jgi:acyl-CoA oxidase
VAFESFEEAAAPLAGSPAGKLLSPLFGLWALDAIGDRAAEHLAHGSLTREEYLVMLDLRRSLLDEVDAEALVDVLDLPFEQIGAPIAFPDYSRRLGADGRP